MLVSDLRQEFYENLIGKRVLLLVHYDVDAICASKILQYLFRTDHILYTLVTVKTKEHLKRGYEDHSEQIKDIILINCGGCIDLLEFLKPATGIRIYIADNHRPFDICNIYNDGQVRIISKLNDDEDVPAFDDVFREESEEEDETDEEGEKRPRFDEAVLEKRREKRLWDQRRHKLLFDYSQFSYYASSTAILMYELAWKLSKDSNETLWWAIVGNTQLLASERVENDKYILATASLQNHVSRLNHQAQDEKPLDSLKISFDKELQLALYRHWTLVESMKHSAYLASTLKLWTLKGEKKMHELLAEIGLPLAECKQNFFSMDITLRNEVQSLLENKAEKFGLTNLLCASFTLSHGFRNKFSAMDFVLASTALLENPAKNKSSSENFLEASDSLSLSKIDILQMGIENCKHLLEAIYRQVTTFLNMKQVISTGKFLYASVLQGSPDADFFSSPHCLTMLAQFTLKALVANSGNKKSKSLPLVIATPDVKNIAQHLEASLDQIESCLICGIPPVLEESPKNFFGKAFEQAAEKTNSGADLYFFDTNIIRLNVNDRSKFIYALTAILS